MKKSKKRREASRPEDPDAGDDSGARAGDSSRAAPDVEGDLDPVARATGEASAAETPADATGETVLEEVDTGEGEAISDRLREELRELEELRDRHLRLAAEFENYRRRTREELRQGRSAAHADLASRLLEVLDDLSRVAETPCEATTTEALHEGVGLVERKMMKVLTDAGMEAIQPEGETFDPNLHEALLMTPTDEPEKDDRVAQVFLTGYKFGDRLLRPARVAVFQFAEEEDA